MNVKDIKEIIATLLKGLKHKAAETLTLPYAKVYISVSILLIALFTVITFPYDILIKNELKSLEKNAVSSIFIGDIDFNFIDITTINNLYVILKTGDELNVRETILDGTTNPYSLFVSRSYSGTVQLSGFKYSSTDTSVTMNLNSNLNLVLDKTTGIPSEGTTKLIIQNLIISFSERSLPPSLSFIKTDRPLQINSITSDLNIKNGNIAINDMKIFGSDMKADISGSVQMDKFWGNSRLNLKISIDPESALISEYKELISGMLQNGKLIIIIEGTAANPALKMPSKQDSSPVYRKS